MTAQRPSTAASPGPSGGEVRVPFFRPMLGPEEAAAVTRVLESGWITMGPETQEFEREIAALVGARHGVAVSSCTAALFLGLEALGVRPGDDVITSSYTFSATANVIEHLGARPVFIDIERDTFNLDATLLERAVTPKTRVILPVHFAGQPCDMDAINEIARDHRISVLDDAAHALGARYEGRDVGTLCDVTAFSFYANKNLTTGDGGMATTDRTDIAERIESTRLHGLSRGAWGRYRDRSAWRYEVLTPGWKANLTDIQAAVGRVQLQRFAGMQTRRAEIAGMFDEALRGLDGIGLPVARPNVTHAWHLYPIIVERDALSIDRDRFIDELSDAGVMTSMHFIPVHTHPYYRERYGFAPGALPVTESAAETEVSLPLFPAMTDDEVWIVVEAVRDIVRRHRR
jgi:dTDP-4-amino-4,6-dideoxygalactose transaminase